MAIPASPGGGNIIPNPNRFEDFADLEYAEIGNRIRIPPRIDPNDQVTEFIRSSMNIVELIPMEFQLNAMKVLETDKWLVNYVYKGKKYIRACKKYGLKTCKGIRLWLTKESTFQEDFRNTYESNTIEQSINKVATTGKFLKSIKSMRSGGQSYGSDYIKKAHEWTNKLIEEHTESKTAAGIWRTAGDIAFMGKQLSLPKIWATSDYQPSLTLVVNLCSPYGSPTAIKKFIVEPIVYLLTLISPRSLNGVSYGYPFTLRVKAHGIASINMGYIDSLSLRRGGTDVSYNQYRQPLSVNVNISIQPLTSGFAAIENEGPNDGNINDVTNPSNFLTIESGSSVATIGSFIDSFKPYGWKKDKQIYLEGTPIDKDTKQKQFPNSSSDPSKSSGPLRKPTSTNTNNQNTSSNNTTYGFGNNSTIPSNMFIPNNIINQNSTFNNTKSLITNTSKFLLHRKNNVKQINIDSRMQVTENIIDKIVGALK